MDVATGPIPIPPGTPVPLPIPIVVIPLITPIPRPIDPPIDVSNSVPSIPVGTISNDRSIHRLPLWPLNAWTALSRRWNRGPFRRSRTHRHWKSLPWRDRLTNLRGSTIRRVIDRGSIRSIRCRTVGGFLSWTSRALNRPCDWLLLRGCRHRLIGPIGNDRSTRGSSLRSLDAGFRLSRRLDGWPLGSIGTHRRRRPLVPRCNRLARLRGWFYRLGRRRWFHRGWFSHTRWTTRWLYRGRLLCRGRWASGCLDRGWASRGLVRRLHLWTRPRLLL